MTDKCENRVDKELESRIDDLRRLWDGYTNAGQECPECEGEGEVFDRGLDDWRKCPSCNGEGVLDEEGNIEDLGNMYEYGLAFDYVAPGTFDNQDEGYFRYQLSWGGPSDEFRIYADKRGQYSWSVYKLEYWFMDWFDGAKRHLRGTDRELVEEIFQSFFVDSGSAEAEYEKAID